MLRARPQGGLPWPTIAFSIAVGAAALASLAIAAADNVWRSRPEAAVRLNPWHGAAWSNLAVRLSEGTDDAGGEAARKAALTAVSVQPVAPGALRVLAQQEDLAGRRVRARTLFELAESTSRRDSMVELWLLEDASQRGDLNGTLRRYDISLRRSRELSNVLFPVLASALDDAAIERAFVPYLSPENPWLLQFTEYVVRKSPKADAFARMIVKYPLPEGTGYRILRSEMIARLIAANHPQIARAVYLRSAEGVRSILNDASFSDAAIGEFGAPITWYPIVNDRVSATFESASTGRVTLALSINGAFAGDVAQKLLFLTAGGYVLELNSINVPADAQVGYRLECLSDGARRTVADATIVSGRMTAFTLSNCPAQLLTLTARTSESVFPVTFSLSSPILKRAPLTLGTPMLSPITEVQ